MVMVVSGQVLYVDEIYYSGTARISGSELVAVDSSGGDTLLSSYPNISSFSDLIVNGGIVDVDSGGAVLRTSVIAAGAALGVFSGGTATSTTLTNFGDLSVYSGGSAVSTIATSGEIGVEDGGFVGNTTLNGAASIVFFGSATSNESIKLSGSGNLVGAEIASAFDATVSGFAAGDVIDLYDFASATSATWANNRLTVTGPSGSVQFALVGNYGSSAFSVIPDGAGGSEVILGGLFTSGADNVNFNSLTTTQALLISNGAEIYNSMDGNDVVVLPNVAAYQLTSNVRWNPSSTFSMGNGNDILSGGDGNYNISVGNGNDQVTITGSGSSTISAGSGVDTFNLGDGTYGVDGGGIYTLNIGSTSGSDADAGITTISGNNSATININNINDTIVVAGSSSVYTVNINGQGDNDKVELDEGGGVINLESDNQTLVIDASGVATQNSAASIERTDVIGGSPATSASPPYVFTVNFGQNKKNQEIDLENIAIGSRISVPYIGDSQTIKLVGYSNVATCAEYNVVPNGSAGELDVYSNKKLIYEIDFATLAVAESIMPYVSNGVVVLKIDPSNVSASDPAGISSTGWNFIHSNEKFELAPYLGPSDTSGVTVGYGVDIGASELSSTDFSTIFGNDYNNNPNLAFLLGTSGDTGAQAKADLLSLGPSLQNAGTVGWGQTQALSITKSEANALDYYAENKAINDLSSTFGNEAWSALSDQVRTVLLDMSYNFGLAKLKSFGFWRQVKAGDWMGAFLNLAFWSTPAGPSHNGLAARRAAEAQLLQSAPEMQQYHVPLLQSVPPVDAVNLAFSVDSSQLNDVFILTESEASGSAAIATRADVLALSSSSARNPLLASSSEVLKWTAKSPQISSIFFADGNASEYLVSTEIGTVWSTSQLVQSGQSINFSNPSLQAIRVTLLDANGVPLAGAQPFAFNVTFASAGAFNGSIVSVDAFSDDFVGDAHSDVLLENTNGAVVVAETGATGQLSYTQIGGLGKEWSFKGAGDFLGDAKTGFLIENTNGAVYVSEVLSGSAQYSQVGGLGPEWSFVETGDFLGDGVSEFLIENTSGAVAVGEIVNGKAQYTVVGGLGPEWTFKGAGDFLGDGLSDFLIENTSGAIAVGEAVNGKAQYHQIGGLGPEWKFEGVGDFLGDGLSDFLIENSNGGVVVGEVQNGAVVYTQVGALGPEWKFVGVGDYGGTGQDSFLIENTIGALATGTVVNGKAQFAQIGALGKEWSFHG